MIDKLSTAQAAERAGVQPATWRSWRQRKLPRGNPVPDPDGWHDARTPWWLKSTIDAWTSRRAGRGARTDLHQPKKTDLPPHVPMQSTQG